MKNIFIIILSYLFLITGLNAETFTAALKKAYINNPELNAELNVSAETKLKEKVNIKKILKIIFISFYILQI